MLSAMKIKDALADPVGLAYRVRARLDRPGLWRRYATLARKAGLKRLFFILSLDCDTAEDIAVVLKVHTRLLDQGIKPVYAVPGKLLETGAEIYREIFHAGGEFLNHGYAEHTYFDKAKEAYDSCFFYDRLEPKRVRQDIVEGDACLREVLGAAPLGFRAPHFGTFQRPAQLRFLHDILGELGYRFSSSTMPVYAFKYGPVFKQSGVWEMPVSGRAESPLSILDSWTCFMAPDRTLTPGCYRREGAAMAEIFRKMGVGLLNYYVDPSHIHDQELFYQTVEDWRQVTQPVNYQEFFKEVL